MNERPDRDASAAGAQNIPRGCPDAEQLAEYADGVLDAAARHAIEAHLVTCADCRFVLVETTAFLGGEAALVSSASTPVMPDETPAADAPAAAPAVVPAAAPAAVPPAVPVSPEAPIQAASEAATPAPQPEQIGNADAAPTSAPRVVPFRTRSWVTGVGATLAAAAALVLIVRIAAPTWLPAWLGGRPPLEELVVALANQPTRPVEGRLMGGFAYASPPSPMRGGTDRLGRRLSTDVEVAAARIAKHAEGNTTAGARAALGVALIVIGELDEAITTLEQAAKDAPDDAAVQSNLSAAYLARARWWNHPEDWPKALAAAERAIALDPDAPEPYFNRALAFEGLEQNDRAGQAWSDYAARDRASGWTREAEERKKALEAGR